MDIEDLIQEKINRIEEFTNNKIEMLPKNNMNVDGMIDFDHWSIELRHKLPIIYIKKNAEKFTKLHELIHMEKFFVDEYSLIVVCSKTKAQKNYLMAIANLYKIIPIDFVVYRLISEYGYNPTNCEKMTWHLRATSIKKTDRDIAANLIDYSNLLEYCPEFRDKYTRFYETVSKRKRVAFNIAEQGILALSETDIHDKESVDKCIDRFIKLFSPKQYVEGTIIAGHLEKICNVWTYVPTFKR